MMGKDRRNEGGMDEGREEKRGGGGGGWRKKKNYWLLEENKPRPRRAKLPLPFKAKMSFSVCFTVNTLK